MHLIEVERKRRLTDAGGELAAQLEANGYRCGGSMAETDTYYSRSDVDFMHTVECLRVRQRDDFAEITYKPPSDFTTHRSGDVIAKLETDVALSGADQTATANQLLVAIGMVLLVRV